VESGTTPRSDAIAVADRDDATDIRESLDRSDTGDRPDGHQDAGMDLPMLRDAMTDRESTDVSGADRTDAALVDRPDVVLPEIPIDPMGVPAPGSECTGDAGVRPGDPSIAPPRPILPQSVSRVTSQRPSFRWALPEGTTGARVEVCADRCCTRVIQTLEAEGTTVRPTTTLPPGVAYWRMFGRRAGVTGSRASYTWEFGVRRRDTPVDSSWGTIRDFTGDGFDDLLLTSEQTNADGTQVLYIMEGGPGGPRMARLFGSMPHSPSLGDASFGDFNGDGRIDLAYNWQVMSHDVRVDVLLSQPSSGPRALQLDVSFIREATLSSHVVTDWNGDGYSDVVTTAYFFNESRNAILGSVLLIYRGSPAGLASRPQQSERLGGLVTRPWVAIIGELGDVDLDGYGDVAVSDRVYARSGQGRGILFGRDRSALRGRFALEAPDLFYQVLAVGDQDGDGFGDIIARTSGSALYLYRGDSDLTSPSGFVSEPRDGGGGSDFGYTIRGGDLNGDGFADLIVGSPTSVVDIMKGTDFPTNRGRMYVYFGSGAGFSASPVWFARSDSTNLRPDPYGFARSVASPGDLNADGVDDVVVVDDRRSTVCYVRGATDFGGARLGDCIAISRDVHVIL